MKKLMAIFLSATLILSMFSGIFTVSAATALGTDEVITFTETINGKTVEVTYLGKNLAQASEGENTLSTFPAANYEAGETVPAQLNYDVSPTIKRYTYNETDGYAEIVGSTFTGGATTIVKQSSVNKYIQSTSQSNGNGFGNDSCAREAIIYEFDNLTTIYDFVFGNAVNTSLYTGAFKVYAGNSLDNIFDETNCYYSYDFTTSAYRSVPAHVIHFAEGIKAKYFVCAVTDPDESNVSEALRVSVFGIYGTKDATVATSDSDFATYKAANITGKANLLADKYPVEFNTRSMGGDIKDGTTWRIRLTTASEGNQNTNMLTNDNDDDGSVYFGNDGEKATDSTTKVTSLVDREDNYVELIYELDGKAEISDISLYWMNMNLYSAQHYIVSLADTQDDVFGANALNIERTTASCSAVMTMKSGITAKYIGVKILCGIADDAKNVIAQNNSAARFGHLDVHGTYVNTITDSDVTVSTETAGVTVNKSDLVIADGTIADANGKYPVGKATTTLTVDPTFFVENRMEYTFAGWKLAGGEIIEGSNVASFEYTPTASPAALEAVFTSQAEALTTVTTSNISFNDYKTANVTDKANLLFGKLPVAYNAQSLGGEVTNCMGYSSKLTNTTSADTLNGEMLNGDGTNSSGSKTKVYFGNDGEANRATITKLVDREDNYVEFIYALDGEAKISQLSIYWNDNLALCAQHYIVSLADTQADLFTENAVNTEVKTASLSSVITPKYETTAKFVGVKIICGVSDAIINHGTYNENYATGRLGHLDVHGTYVDAIGNDDISVATDTIGVNVAKTDLTGANPDANGEYPIGAVKTTLTVDKTNFTEGDTEYTFLGWRDDDSDIIEGSNVASFEYTATAPAGFVAVYSSVVKYVVNFADMQGNVIYSTKVVKDGYLSTDDIDAATANLPEIFGYNKVLDDGAQEWNRDVTASITNTITFMGLYELDTETTYSVNGNEEFTFDQKVMYQNETPVSWKVNGQFADYGTEFTFYVFGDMTVTMSDEAAPSDLTVSILGSAEKGDMFVTFARVYNPENVEISAMGTRYTSSYVYNNYIGDSEWDDASLSAKIADFAHKKEQYVADAFITGTNAKDYMTILSPVPNGKARYAKAFVETDDGIIFSNLCGNAATQQ